MIVKFAVCVKYRFCHIYIYIYTRFWSFWIPEICLGIDAVNPILFGLFSVVNSSWIIKKIIPFISIIFRQEKSDFCIIFESSWYQTLNIYQNTDFGLKFSNRIQIHARFVYSVEDLDQNKKKIEKWLKLFHHFSV